MWLCILRFNAVYCKYDTLLYTFDWSSHCACLQFRWETVRQGKTCKDDKKSDPWALSRAGPNYCVIRCGQGFCECAKIALALVTMSLHYGGPEGHASFQFHTPTPIPLIQPHPLVKTRVPERVLLSSGRCCWFYNFFILTLFSSVQAVLILK